MQEPIVLADISTYSGYEQFTTPYRNGYELALSEINAADGINGRILTVLSRDDFAKSDKALAEVRALNETQNLTAIFGTAMFGIANTLSDYAEDEGIIFLASLPMDDSLLSSKRRQYTFRLRATSRMQAAMLAETASNSSAKRWVTIAPNYPFGWDAVDSFKSRLIAERPDTEFVDSIWPERGALEPGAVLERVKDSNPDAIFNATFGPDLVTIVEAATDAGLLKDRLIVSMLAGEPEYARTLNADALTSPWIVTGYPTEDANMDLHANFREAYMEAYSEEPIQAALVGYTTMKTMAAALRSSPDLSADSISEAFISMRAETPVGPIEFRASDHQSTMGTWVGSLGLSENVVTIKDYEYRAGTSYMPDYPSKKSK